MHLPTDCGTRKKLVIPTKPPVLKQQSHTPKRALSEKREESYHFTHPA